MERDRRTTLTLFTAAELAAGAGVTLDEDASHHARVRRAREGDSVRLVDGAGTVASATIERVGTLATVAVQEVRKLPRPIALEAIVPVADRDRMLLAAEKCVELGVTAWRPAWFVRSRSVSPRGEGDKFREKVLARMRAALEQSRGAWLPEVHAEGDIADVATAIPADYTRLALEQGGAPFLESPLQHPSAIVVGPEGGYDSMELELLRNGGWRMVSLGASVLRFETAIIAAAAIIRAAQPAPQGS